MKKLLSLLLLTLVAGCGGDDASTTETSFEDHAQARAIVEDFSQKVVVPTYALLAERLGALHQAAEALQGDASAANLDAARAAWVAARSPWEQSEGFLFGPVDARGYDPALDSWPVNRVDLDAVLLSGDDLNAAYMTSLDATLKGFHTAEYLLFDETVSGDLGDRELMYLVATTAEMAGAGDELHRAWTEGLDGEPAYAGVLEAAGSADSVLYPSKQSAAEEIVRGAIGILDEVANGKIADPFDEQDTKLVESQFSFNSLTDFTNNVRSVQNAYLGAVPDAGTSGVGLTAFVADVDADLDARLKGELTAALAALGEIPEPFRDAITDPAAADKIRAAQEAIRAVQTTMEGDVLPLVTR